MRFRFPLILFIVVPLAELLLLFEVAARIGGIYTLLLVVTTAFIGVTVLKRQGLHTLNRANLRMSQGQLPAQEIIEGMLLAFAGALLLTPGLITDAIGFTLLTPPARRAIARRILRSGSAFFVGGMGAGPFRPGAGDPGSRPDSRGGGHTVEGEYEAESDSGSDSRLGRRDPDRRDD